MTNEERAFVALEVAETCINKLKKENKQLQACHDSELGVCEKHCDVVAQLRKDIELLEQATGYAIQNCRKEEL